MRGVLAETSEALVRCIDLLGELLVDERTDTQAAASDIIRRWARLGTDRLKDPLSVQGSTVPWARYTSESSESLECDGAAALAFETADWQSLKRVSRDKATSTSGARTSRAPGWSRPAPKTMASAT